METCIHWLPGDGRGLDWDDLFDKHINLKTETVGTGETSFVKIIHISEPKHPVQKTQHSRFWCITKEIIKYPFVLHTLYCGIEIKIHFEAVLFAM